MSFSDRLGYHHAYSGYSYRVLRTGSGQGFRKSLGGTEVDNISKTHSCVAVGTELSPGASRIRRLDQNCISKETILTTNSHRSRQLSCFDNNEIDPAHRSRLYPRFNLKGAVVARSTRSVCIAGTYQRGYTEDVAVLTRVPLLLFIMSTASMLCAHLVYQFNKFQS